MIDPDLVVLGCLTLDSVVTAAGECLPQTFGGNVLYSALGARVWNDRVGAVSRYGTGYPEAAFELLRSRGINADGIRHLGFPHGRQIAFCYTEDGSRTRVFPPDVIARIPAADRPRFVDVSLLPDAAERWLAFAPNGDDIPPAWWSSMTAVHCAAMPVATQSHIARSARAHRGRNVHLQVDSLWHDPQRPEIDYAASLFDDIDILLPSEADVRTFDPDRTLDGAVAGLLARGAKTVVLKHGSSGCQIYRRGRGLIAEVPVVDVKVADPTGAGDAFCGGFLAGFKATGDLVTAARYGTVSASYAVEARGLDGLVRSTPSDAAERLASLVP